MNCRAKIFSLLFTYLLSISSVKGQGAPGATPNLMVKHTNDFIITGVGNGAAWTKTIWDTIIQRDRATLEKEGWRLPSDSAGNVLYGTRFKVLYSEKGLYFLYECEDSIITSTITADYGALYNEDVVEVFLRPDTALPAYFEYELSPLNYELPIMILNNKGNAMGWKPWLYEGRRKTQHAINVKQPAKPGGRLTWTAEIFIPFALLAPMVTTPPKKGTKWHANFYRIDYDLSPAYSSWRLTKGNYHDYERFGVIEFD